MESQQTSSLSILHSSSTSGGVGGNVGTKIENIVSLPTPLEVEDPLYLSFTRPSPTLARVGSQSRRLKSKMNVREMFSRSSGGVGVGPENAPASASASASHDANQRRQTFVDARSVHQVVAGPQIVAEATQAVASARRGAELAAYEAQRTVTEISRQAQEKTLQVSQKKSVSKLCRWSVKLSSVQTNKCKR